MLVNGQEAQCSPRLKNWTRLGMACVILMCFLTLNGAVAQNTPDKFERPADHYAYAQGLMQGKIYDYALKAFDAFIAANPEHDLVPAAASNGIDCYRQLGDIDGMLERIKAFREKWPNHPNADVFTFWEGEAYFAREDFDKATEAFTRLLDSKSSELKEYGAFFLAQCKVRKNPADATAYDLYAGVSAKPLHKSKPYRELALADLARYQQLQLQYDKALASYRRLAEYKDGVASYRENAFYNIGEIFFSQEKYAGAKKAFDEYLVRYPEGKWVSDVLCRRAEAIYQLGNYSEALKCVIEWRGKYPEVDDYEMDCLNGRCLYKLHEYSTAGPYFEAAFRNEDAPEGIRRYSLVLLIHCLLEEKTIPDWNRGLEYCRIYFQSYKDAMFETNVCEFRSGLLEKLGRYQEAADSYAKTIDMLVDTEESRYIRLRLKQVSCLKKLEKWHDAAGLLRTLAEKLQKKKDAQAAERVALYLCNAADLELKIDSTSPQAEKDLNAVLNYQGIPDNYRRLCHERLLGIHIEQGNYSLAYAENKTILKELKTNSERADFLFREGWLLDKMARADEAVASLNAVLELLKDSAPTRRLAETHALLMKLSLDRVTAGNKDAIQDVLKEYACLVEMPATLTDGLLTDGILYGVTRPLQESYDDAPTPEVHRRLIEIYQRIIQGMTVEKATATELFAAYYLSLLYMERQDGRFAEAKACLHPCVRRLEDGMKDPKAAGNAFLQEITNPNVLLNECLTRLAICQYHTGNTLEALECSERVLREDLKPFYAKQCLLLQARIYYEGTPKQLEKALGKLMKCTYIKGEQGLPPEDEEEMIVLCIKVQMELKRLDSAKESYRQLKVRFPERAKRETTFHTLE